MFIFLDTETTGTEKEDRLCQLAYKTEAGKIANQLFKPPLPIKIDSMCVHHITNEMVADKPAFKDSHEYQKLVGLLSGDKRPTMLNLMWICLKKKESMPKGLSVL